MASVLLSKEDQVSGTVIYTDYQSCGKGQRGNFWESAKGENILISIILQTNFVEPNEFFNLTIITSLAIHDVLTDYLSEGIKIKWPNDLYYRDKKIAGILIENFIKQNVIEWCIVGVGLNVNQKRFEDNIAISLAQICNQKFNVEELINILIQKVELRYFQLKNGEIEQLRKDYLTKLYWKNELHVFQSEGTYFNGRIVDVELSGKLMIEVEEGTRTFDFKEVSFIK